VGHERFEEPAALEPNDSQRRRAALRALPEIEHQAATCLQVDNDATDGAGLSPVDLVELFQRGRSGQPDGVERVGRHQVGGETGSHYRPVISW
jgi:hypothetical protein